MRTSWHLTPDSTAHSFNTVNSSAYHREALCLTSSRRRHSPHIYGSNSLALMQLWQRRMRFLGACLFSFCFFMEMALLFCGFENSEEFGKENTHIQIRDVEVKLGKISGNKAKREKNRREESTKILSSTLRSSTSKKWTYWKEREEKMKEENHQKNNNLRQFPRIEGHSFPD